MNSALAAQLCPSLQNEGYSIGGPQSNSKTKQITAWWHSSTHEKYYITITMKISQAMSHYSTVISKRLGASLLACISPYDIIRIESAHTWSFDWQHS